LKGGNLNAGPKPFAQRKPENGKLIAVGGAKGGIGKSLFSINMAVMLSRMGFCTVIADLDLGSSEQLQSLELLCDAIESFRPPPVLNRV
jgi:Mrp family chromosome partitioning ATPase